MANRIFEAIYGLLGTIFLVFAAIASVDSNYAKATTFGVLAIAMILLENQANKAKDED